jgi:hypothetical protein
MKFQLAPLVLAICVFLCALTSGGCESAALPPGPQLHPLPESIRQRLGSIGYVVDVAKPDLQRPWSKEEARGKGAAAGMTGAAQLAGGFNGGYPPGYAAAGILVIGVPIGALLGAISGPAKALPAAEIRQYQQRLTQAFGGLDIQHIAAASFGNETRARTGDQVRPIELPPTCHPNTAALEAKCDTLLHLEIVQFGLHGSGDPNPRLTPFIVLRARLIRLSDGTSVYVNTWKVEMDDERHTFAEWAAKSDQEIRQVFDTALSKMIPRIVDELFLACSI